jgi:monoamine oxidase
MGPGLLIEYAQVLRAPWKYVHFVGTETAYEWKGYMEGAGRAGERGAGDAIELFTRT